MKLYFAPLEGITKYVYRNTHSSLFSGCDGYFAPFINPSDQEKISKKGINDIYPSLNTCTNLKVQVLTNNAESFRKFEEKIVEMGYDEININLGCPAATVVKKMRGSGFLQIPDELDRFLNDVFENTKLKVSVKSRIGYSSVDEYRRIYEIYNQYPISLLIVHPRTKDELYRGFPHREIFSEIYKTSKNPICYNGDIFSKEDYEKIISDFPLIDSVMLGRGAVANPALFREIKGGSPLSCDELKEYSELLCKNYYEVLGSETFTLHKLKEIWVYVMMYNFPSEKKVAKLIKKSNTISEFLKTLELLPEL